MKTKKIPKWDWPFRRSRWAWTWPSLWTPMASAWIRPCRQRLKRPALQLPSAPWQRRSPPPPPQLPTPPCPTLPILRCPAPPVLTWKWIYENQQIVVSILLVTSFITCQGIKTARNELEASTGLSSSPKHNIFEQSVNITRVSFSSCGLFNVCQCTHEASTCSISELHPIFYRYLDSFFF